MKKLLIFSGISILALVLIVAGLGAAGTAPQNATSNRGPVAGDAGNVTVGNNRFGFDLYRRFATDPAHAGANLFFSPYSISSALAITYEGARGMTADEMESVLHLPKNDTLRREGFTAIDASLNRRDTNYTLRTANALWVEETYSLLPEYIETTAHCDRQTSRILTSSTTPRIARRSTGGWKERPKRRSATFSRRIRSIP